jgi:hypothetical protein
MVSDLNSNNAAGREYSKIRLEVAGAFLYVRKFPEDLAMRIENSWAIFCIAQRFQPGVE